MLLSLLFSDPLLFAAIIIAIVAALSFHEYSHALTAHWLGDPTADRMGRMTLNPLAHLDPIGFLMLLIVGFGYAKPVPYDPRYLRNPRSGSLLIGFAGPISNLILASAFAIALKIAEPALGGANLLVGFCYFGAIINVNLAVFNLIPIPPLDGSKLLNVILAGPEWRNLRIAIERQGPIVLLMLIIIDAVSGIGIFSRIFEAVGGIFFRIWGISI
jgi:Zn-dependent protease